MLQWICIGVLFGFMAWETIRNRIVLPRRVLRLGEARRALKAAEAEVEEVRKDKSYLEGVLADVLDAEGNVRGQLRLPGELPPQPLNKTPCGKSCRRAYWDNDDSVWRCAMNQGIEAGASRPSFLTDEGQCAHYKYVEPGIRTTTRAPI